MLVNPSILADNVKYYDGIFHTKFHFNGNHELGIHDAGRLYPSNLPCDCYGTCDNPKQFHEKFAKALILDSKPLVVMMTHVEKDPNNKGIGGGWRWHKWGRYFGDGEPTEEYLDDELEFESGVYVYEVYDVSGLDFIESC